MATRDHAAMLAERRGGKLCPAVAKEELLSGKSFWSPEDLPVDGVPEAELDDTLNLWKLVFEDCAGEEDSKVVSTVSEFFRFSVWVKKPVDVAIPDVSDGDVHEAS